jgi:hypothetical protein
MKTLSRITTGGILALTMSCLLAFGVGCGVKAPIVTPGTPVADVINGIDLGLSTLEAANALIPQIDPTVQAAVTLGLQVAAKGFSCATTQLESATPQWSTALTCFTGIQWPGGAATNSLIASIQAIVAQLVAEIQQQIGGGATVTPLMQAQAKAVMAKHAKVLAAK